MDDDDLWGSNNDPLLKKLFGSGHSGQTPSYSGLTKLQKSATPYVDLSKLFPPYQSPESPLQLAQGISSRARDIAPQINPVAPPNRVRPIPVGGLATGSQQPSTFSSNNLPEILQALRR